MNTLSYKTVSINKETAKKEWVVIDATDQVVGRLASKVAKLIRGKYKPSYTPHVDCGDNVIIIGISAWLGHDGYWLYPLITASAYAIETQVPGGYFRSWYLAGLTLATCFFSDFNFLVQNLSMVYVYIMCATFIIFLPEIRAAAFTEAKGDRNNKRINPRRLQVAQGVFLMIVIALGYLHGDSQAQSLIPAYMAAIGCGLYLVPALMQKKK